ncbi:MAG: glutamate-1-semialdehyde 2,1-aminomutase [Deltaproteobacteria bacterium]|nr:glutamate-1-semialdehyde 2,1-aminomutase [Deltaproteobacteria bacterium]
MNTQRSAELFQRAQKSIPGGVNSPVRAFKSVGGNPLFIERGKGAWLYDADGNAYVDYVGSWGPLILGHADERILAAVREALERGTSFGAPTQLETTLAEMVKEIVPGLDLVRFVSSGSEAAMAALRVARGFTGREKIIKFAGCYHGAVDALLVKAGSGATTLGVPDSAGVTAGVAADTLLADFNNLAQVEALAAQNPGRIAAVILEAIPGNMGMIWPDESFLKGLRALCDREGIVLICDEVMTGFRVGLTGAQGLLGLKPDLSIFGKVIGGGMPVGAYGGRRDIMEKVAPLGPVYQAGTLSGNPVAMAAGMATLRVIREPGFFQRLEAKSKRLMDGFAQAAKEQNLPLQTLYAGGMMGFFFAQQPVKDYTQALASHSKRYVAFFQAMLAEGVYLAPSAFEALFVSEAHGEDDIAKTLAAARKAMAQAAQVPA